MRPYPTTSKAAAPDFISRDVRASRRFYLDLKPPKNRQLVVVCGGLEYCTPNFAIHRKTFPFYSIEYVVRGRGKLRLNRHTFSLQAGRVFSYGPGVSQDIIGQADEPLVKYFVDFIGTQAMDFLERCGLPPGSVSEVFPSNALQPLLDELIRVGAQPNSVNVNLSAELLKCLTLRLVGTRAPLDRRETRAYMTYQRCRGYLEQHSLRLKSLTEVAEECHLSKPYLCRLFRRYENQSPYQYLLRLKMNHAAERLQQPQALIKQVAEQTGFVDQFHFTRVFTSVFGLSPTAFRDLR